MPSAIESTGIYAKKKTLSKYEFVYSCIELVVNNLPLLLLQSQENVDFGLITHTHCTRDIEHRRNN